MKFSTKYLTPVERKLYSRLSTPARIQDYLETLPINFRNTYRSPRGVVQEQTAHCFEGAVFAAAALWFHGSKPLLLDLKSVHGDDDHVVALFQEKKRWGAVSKTNHAVLRYRDPIYLSVRELAASYFHEYFTDTGRKTLLSFSEPYDLSRAFGGAWIVREDDLNDIVAHLDASKHTKYTPSRVFLRRADRIEREAGKIVAWTKRA